MSEVVAAVVEAELDLAEGADPAAVGALVSDGLCGRWDHEGPCRWPHRNLIDPNLSPARFRTVVVAVEAEMPQVLEKDDTALRGDSPWRVLSAERHEPQGDEREIADQLAAVERLVP